MIKVGQVYQTERLEIVLITRVVGFHFYIITPSGMTGNLIISLKMFGVTGNSSQNIQLGRKQSIVKNLR